MSELMFKDQKVLTLKDIGGVPSEIQKIDNAELLPLCMNGECTIENLKKWLDGRSIPETREGLKEVREEFGMQWQENKHYASLTDQYWLRKRGEAWRKINFFNNLYSNNIGDLFFQPWTVTGRKYDIFSPDLTTNGILKKRWRQYSDKTSYLIKAGSVAAHQEPLSEVLVSVLCEQLQIIPCVKYDLCIEGITMCCRCDNMITEDSDLVPASYIYYSEPRNDKDSVFVHLVKMCDKFDIPGAEEFLEGMVFIDKLSGNRDRNLGNIFFIRNADTLKFIGPAPLCDSGNAYWNSKDINGTEKSNLFGDVENKIVKKLKKKYNLNVLKQNNGYKKLIAMYPAITETKKENLISAISKRNDTIINDIDFSR